MMIQVTVPDVGEATEVEVIEVLVAVGDVVGKDDSLVVLESDKARWKFRLLMLEKSSISPSK